MSAKAFISKFILCNPDQSGILNPQSVLSKGTDQEGGTVKFSGAAVVDGHLKSTKIVATTGHDMLFSAMSDVEDCVVDGKNVMIEGDFSGEITIQDGGVLEVGDSGKVVGVVYTTGAVIIHAGADAAELKVIKTTAKDKEETLVASNVVMATTQTWRPGGMSSNVVAEAA